MNNTFGDVKGTAVIADDLLVYGGDDIETATADHDKNLQRVLERERARERNLKLNKEKDHTAEATLSSSEASPAYDDASAKLQAEGSLQARPRDVHCRHLEQGVHTLIRPGNTG